MTKKIVFIGNRFPVARVCLEEPTWRIEKVYAVQSSYLARELKQRGVGFQEFQFKDKDKVCGEIADLDFDILVSNGCPFIIPLKHLNKDGRLFLNTHPSLLPELKGPHPVNGAVLWGHKKFGATTHYMVEDVDAGNIVYQAERELKPEYNIRQIYEMSFELEGMVFAEAKNLLKTKGYKYSGIPQVRSGSHYRRKPEDMYIDFGLQSAQEILNRIRAFGIESLGCQSNLMGKRFLIFEGSLVPEGQSADFDGSGLAVGEAKELPDGTLIVRVSDGIIRLTKFRDENG